MDIKDLNKSQLILLAILLSFVTSIATGITTVTLMQQAPESVTVPINRVVRQTVEKIEQVKGDTTVQTIVVKEEDLIVDAIAKNKPSVFSITKNVRDQEVPAGYGFAVSADVVVVDALWVPERDDYFVSNDTGRSSAELLFVDPKGFSFLRVNNPSALGGIQPITDRGDITTMKIGQKIIVLSNTIHSLVFDGNRNVKIATPSKIPGGLVLDLDGEVLGISLSADSVSFANISSIDDSFRNNI